MARAQDDIGRHANALEALASGRPLASGNDAAPAGPMEHVAVATPPQQALGSLAAGEPAPDDALGELAGLRSGNGAGNGLPAAASQAATFPRPVRRAARTAVAMRRVQSHHYKKFMVPILAVVGCLLLGFSLFTIFALATAGDDPTATAAKGTYFHQYGLLFVLVSLPMGAILLLGSWLFHAELKTR